MKAVTVNELKQELNNRTPKELLGLCLRLCKTKKIHPLHSKEYEAPESLQWTNRDNQKKGVFFT